MNWITYNLQGIAHLDQYLIHWASEYGPRVYLLLFTIVFCETGLILTPFLPGDTLMFVAGALLADGFFHPVLLPAVLIIGAFLGNSCNYGIGRFFGRALLNSRWKWLVRKKYLDQTHLFFERYGKKTIVLCRFIPIVRTFAPFVAGVGRMNFPIFMLFNFLGAFLWVGILGLIGYIFGHMPIVKAHFEWAIITVVVLSLLPGILALLTHRKKKKKNDQIPV
jgi:membrane-associated protein